MNWEQRVKIYLESLNYELLGFEGGLVFYKDTKGKVWGSGEEPFTRTMVEWEKGI